MRYHTTSAFRDTLTRTGKLIAMLRDRRPLLVLLVALSAAMALQLVPRGPPWVAAARSMRGRLGGAAVRCSDGDDDAAAGAGGEEGIGGRFKQFFGTNRNSPEALANQEKWAREQMALEVPKATATGSEIADREDFIRQYIVSEQERFGREIDRATAETEVDEWLLKQATNASTQTTSADLAIAGAVFVAAFGLGLYFAGGTTPS
jgi:hypothetical protein